MQFVMAIKSKVLISNSPNLNFSRIHTNSEQTIHAPSSEGNYGTTSQCF